MRWVSWLGKGGQWEPRRQASAVHGLRRTPETENRSYPAGGSGSGPLLRVLRSGVVCG